MNKWICNRKKILDKNDILPLFINFNEKKPLGQKYDDDSKWQIAIDR